MIYVTIVNPYYSKFKQNSSKAYKRDWGLGIGDWGLGTGDMVDKVGDEKTIDY
ncbi:hypothetical protein [Nostoc sp. CMAA1605]|uniref:hypothetical protein n=1 Tax=Nostoc sp. CMAA1605 TaxID=2055159 RepID=UPI001F1C73A8|nr:hypothetical protein [Nostoc sp. CMAA1605]